MKKIIITGKNNIDSFKSKENKIKIKSLNQEYNIEEQLYVINNIYNNNTLNNFIYKFTIREIENKINSYKHQDIKKNIFNGNLLIKYKEVINKLFISKLKCDYCSDNIKIIYRISRDNKQWTLDRINNDLCHSSSNTIISCLQCNIKRKLIDKYKFEFTKKLKIIKIN
jgi:hypothetical protein